MTSTVNKSLKIINARVTYRKAAIYLLEKFTFRNLEAAYKMLLEKADLKECVIVQTCNRVEIFAAGDNPNEQKLLECWAAMVGLSDKDFTHIAEVSKDNDVILHLMKLGSGLDSLVIGEDQVLHQLKSAFEYSLRKNYAGSHLSSIFKMAVKSANRVRKSTGISKGSISIGSIAVNLAEEHFDYLKDKRIMLIGSGQGASLIAKSLNKRDVKFVIASRTIERAKSFAETVAGDPILFEEALARLHEFDLIFISTTAPYYLITYDRIEEAINKREKGMIIFDLSNPRAVEERVKTIMKVKLINMDQIAEVVEGNMRSRKNEIQVAEKMIDIEMKSADVILKRNRAEPTVVSIFKRVDTIRDHELKKALSLLGKAIGPRESRIIEQLSYAVVEGILSSPMNNLRKEIETSNEEEELMKLVVKLFNYEDKRYS
jgi:glutamyl-tRNA reductase